MVKKHKVKKIYQKSLTLNDLVKYNQEVLFPAMDHKFAKIDNKFIKIDNHFAKIDEKFAKIDDHFEEIHKEIKEKFDKVMIGQDKILKEITDSRSENIAGVDLYKRQDKKLENHEIRIKIVEQKVGVVAIK